MDNGQAPYDTLVPLTDFKTILGIDDREMLFHSIAS
jgi:hypothetical protein